MQAAQRLAELSRPLQAGGRVDASVAQQIGEQPDGRELVEAHERPPPRDSVEAEVDAGVVRHGESLLPVLARRVQAVDEALDEAFPGMTHRSLRTTNGFGWAAGRAAADLADLGVGERLCAPA